MTTHVRHLLRLVATNEPTLCSRQFLDDMRDIIVFDLEYECPEIDFCPDDIITKRKHKYTEYYNDPVWVSFPPIFLKQIIEYYPEALI